MVGALIDFMLFFVKVIEVHVKNIVVLFEVNLEVLHIVGWQTK